MPRMRILNAAEQAHYGSPPVFSSAERKRVFDFSQSVMEAAHDLRSTANRIGFLLGYGYFRATRRFFSPVRYHARDIAFVSRIVGASANEFSRENYKERTRLHHQGRILDLQGFRPFGTWAENQLTTEIAKMARVHLKPRIILGHCIDVLIANRVQLPSARRLTDLIRARLGERKEELIRLTGANLPSDLRVMLDGLFVQEDGGNRYRLTLLGTISQSTRPGKIRKTVADLEILAELHGKIAPALEILDIGSEGIRYYAGGVHRSEMFQLQRRSNADRYLHAIAFIADQHHRLQDATVDMLLSVMQSFRTTVDREHKDEVFTRRKSAGARFEQMLDDVDAEASNLRHEIRVLLDNEIMSDTRKLESIRIILDRDQDSVVDILRADIRKSAAADESLFHDILEDRSIRLQNRVSPILKQIELIGDASAADLMAAIAYFREKDGSIGPGMPRAFLNSAERDAVSNGPKGFRVSLCKVFLFQHVAAAIKSGSLNLDGSCKYRPLDDYLIGRERWERERPELLERAGLAEFDDPDPVLRELEAALQQQYETTNRAASDGSNPYLKVRSPGDFRVLTPAAGDVESEPLRDVMPKRYMVPLSEVLATVDQHCGMFEEFRHWQQVNVGPAPSAATTIAGIMGLGCAIGVQKMARISREITERELEYAVNWRFSLENIVAANDRVVAAMERMELPQIYRRSRDTLHTSSDGQKFEVRKPSLNASHSFKYFGQIQGISAYTFIDERGFLWYSLVFSAAERESVYVIDGLMHNDVVQSDIHSTDEHGFMEAVFCVTHLLGISYAPRFKDLKKHNLYQFRNSRDENVEWAIMPTKHVNEKAVRASWDDLLRLVATIRLKEATASEIFRRLNSYSRQHRLYAAMKAFGQIIKSVFILRYVDQVEKEAQEVAEGCNRLIKNSIICWNYLYLTRQLEAAKTPEARDNILKMVTLHSPQTWWYINMLGEYDLSNDRLRDNTGVLPPKSAPAIIPENWEPPNR